MKIEPKPGITQEELLAELKAMTWEEILSIPLSSQFTGMFETFAEMGKIVEMMEKDKIKHESVSSKEPKGK